MDLAAIENYYDTVPRVSASTEEVGPFTLFLADDDTGWQFYARPRLGLTSEITADDVRRVRARQRELGKPEALEWVHEVTPSLLPAVRSAIPDPTVEECPLLALVTAAGVTGDDLPGRHVALAPDDPDLALAVAVVAAAFDGDDEPRPRGVGRRPELMASGALVIVASYDEDGRLVGAGSAAPRGEVSELMGIGVLPSARRHGVGAAVTRELVREVARRGVATAFLSAASDDAANVYRAVGFERIGTACILGGA